MKDLIKRISALAVLCAMLFTFSACLDITGFETVTDSGLEIVTGKTVTTAPAGTDANTQTTPETVTIPENDIIEEFGEYTSKDDVCLYLHVYGRLPKNFITKAEAQKLGWSGGGLDDYAYGKCIGGDRFGNYEGLLPKKENRIYYECDIDTLHADSRGSKRIIFSNDGLIFYTEDHYESFEKIRFE